MCPPRPRGLLTGDKSAHLRGSDGDLQPGQGQRQWRSKGCTCLGGLVFAPVLVTLLVTSGPLVGDHVLESAKHLFQAITTGLILNKVGKLQNERHSSIHREKQTCEWVTLISQFLYSLVNFCADLKDPSPPPSYLQHNCLPIFICCRNDDIWWCFVTQQV